MPEIKVTFSDGKTVIFNEEKSFQTFIKEGTEIHTGEIYTLYSHHKLGLTIPFLDIISKCTYFFDIENENIVYFSDSIIRVEEI